MLKRAVLGSLFAAVSAVWFLNGAAADVLVDSFQAPFQVQAAGNGKAVQDPFGYGDYSKIVDGLPEKREYRLCGLNKVCMKLWEEERLEVSKAGRCLTGDFNGDGVVEEAVILEKDEPTGREFYVCIWQKDQAPSVEPYYEELPINARNVLGMTWSEDHHAIAIDTGERVTRRTSISIDGVGIGNRTSHKAQLEKLIAWVSWNPKAKQYDMSVKNEIAARTTH